MRIYLKRLIGNGLFYQFSKQFYVVVVSAKKYFRFSLLKWVFETFWYCKEVLKYKKSGKNKKFMSFKLQPCLGDNTENTPLEPTYFFQDTWAAKHIFILNPDHHYDVGSSAKTMGIISQFVPTTMIDIRPVELELDNFYFKKGSILELPFKDGEIDSLSSLCVVEHIGLGRYGDPIDCMGSEKAIKELHRVLSVGGTLLVSVPVDKENTVYFNAHRAFSRDYLLELFADFEIEDEKYHYGTNLFDYYDPDKGFGTGFFRLKKIHDISFNNKAVF